MNTNNNNNSHLETSTTQKITTPHQTERNNPHTEDLDQNQCTDRWNGESYIKRLPAQH